MRTVFADTFYLLALWNPQDKAHAKAMAFTQAYRERMLTTDWIMTKEGITDALTADHHFEQAGFVALLKP